MINFRYRLCRLMEFILDKRLVKAQRSKIAVGGHPLPDNWVDPKKLPRTLRLPPCAGGPIPSAYAQEDVRAAPEVEMEDGDLDLEESDEVREERSEKNPGTLQ
jgi:hypothetical protein